MKMRNEAIVHAVRQGLQVIESMAESKICCASCGAVAYAARDRIIREVKRIDALLSRIELNPEEPNA